MSPAPLLPTPAEPFDRGARRQQRERAIPGGDFIARALAADLHERIAAVGRRFAIAVDIGGCGVAGDELTVRIDVTSGAAAMGVDAARVAGDFAAAGDVVGDHAVAGDVVGDFAAAGDAVGDHAAAGDVVGDHADGDNAHRVVADEDRLPLADASVDVIAALGLHGVGDLPGALILARRALRPGGLFVAALVGGTTLAEVRADLLAAEVALTGRAAARVLPMVDPDAAAGLLQRAGFVDPVVDVDTLTVRYDDLAGLLRDLRAAGAGNILYGREPLRRDVLAEAARRFAARAVGGRVGVTVQAVYLTGWGRAG